jgi:pSer/pThr/pTyr-binding forkhead associated (FHA) protein
MKQPLSIVVQLVHIEGPLKGEVQDYPMPEITIGRQSSCEVCFPKDVAVVSRQHARIVREGNRFKLIDQSSNGTFLNGKQVKEAYLKDGDVLMFAEGGPKVSFLTQALAQPAGTPAMEAALNPPPRVQPPPPPEPAAAPPGKPSFEEAPTRPPSPPVQARPQPAPSSQAAYSPEIPVQRIRKPLNIQYGPTLRSFNDLPVTIGQGAGCDFILNHPAIYERHAQVVFYQEQYWIKDLSGMNPILVDGRPIDRQAVLEPDCRLSLSDQGPEFRFLGGGRLAEIEPAVEVPEPPPDRNAPGHAKTATPVPGIKEIGSMVKRFLKK